MTGRVLLTVGLLLLCCAPLGRAEAATTVNTQTLRLTFDGQGNLESAIACFPACSGESVRLQQFADDGLIRIGPRAGGRWAVAENRSADHHELSFTGPDGSRLAWRIPQQGYRLELELATGAGLSIRSGPSFRPREAAGFGNWLEQSRYAIINEEAVRLSGHNTSGYKIAAFTLCGASVGVAGIMYMLRLNMASPILGVGFELNAIAAVVIGGTSMMGGKGSLIGTFLGASIIGVLNNGLLLLGMGDFARQIVTGLIIVAAVVIDTYRAKLLVRFQ